MTPAANTPGGSAQTYAPGSARPLSGDALQARALAVPVEPRVAPRLAGFATSIAIAALSLAACGGPDARLKECNYVTRPALGSSGSHFYYMEDTAYVDGPNMCRQVTDTEGWDRTFCHKGPDAAVCRRVRR
jgi:hypothetical protein